MRITRNDVMKKTIKAFAAIVPGTEVPMAEVGRYGRYFVLLCDHDAEEQAIKMSSAYPKPHQLVVPVEITFELPDNASRGDGTV